MIAFWDTYLYWSFGLFAVRRRAPQPAGFRFNSTSIRTQAATSASAGVTVSSGDD
ncbi:MAG: hypothetical protein JWN71_4506 [Xanthobacteraceae bacterium]|jgi:hypothetical protein|nr:hypothetical protein [Xanthobacteraceae bacterium]